jgi:hypothetical protein
MASNRNAPVWATIALVILGLALGVVSVIYFAETAGNLPSFFPGHAAGSTHHHTKHGIVAALVALIALAGAWLSRGQKKKTTA